MSDNVLFGAEGWEALAAMAHSADLKEWHILTDAVVDVQCLPVLFEKVPGLQTVERTVIPTGEGNKSLLTAEHVMTRLLKQGMERQGTLVCVGGGKVTDLGGFIASVYKRGVRHINIPTTLMAQTDAALGGKTAVNIGQVKNAAGTFHWPKLTVIDRIFLHTLPGTEVSSGMAEVIKHAIIADADLFKKLEKHGRVRPDEAILSASARVKMRIVAADPMERGLRKALNFGHSVGHAVEGFYALSADGRISHGAAVAAGMRVESALASAQGLITRNDLNRIMSLIDVWSDDEPQLSVADVPHLLALMANDKKNVGGRINFSLPDRIGNVLTDRWATPEEVRAVLVATLVEP